MLPNINKNYLLTYLLTDAVHNQMDKADNIPLEQESIYNQSLKKQKNPLVTNQKCQTKWY